MSKSRSGRSVKIPHRFQPGRNNDAEEDEAEPRKKNGKGASDELIVESREQTRLLRKLVRKAEELESVLCDVQAELANIGVVKKPKSEEDVPVPISLQASMEAIPIAERQREATPPLVIAEPSPAIVARLNTLCSDLVNKDEAK